MHGPTPIRIAKPQRVIWAREPKRSRSRPHFLYYFFAHEMFHVTQHTYRAFIPCKVRGGTHGWVQESFATAVGMDYARKKYSSMFPISKPGGAKQPEMLLDVNLSERAVSFDVAQREALSAAGGREYHVPLNLQAYKDNGDEENSGVPRYYRTSGLWRHISELYYGGDYTFIQDYMLVNPVNDDWLDWAHRNVKAGVNEPLARVFALYMADVANWYRPDRPATIFNESEWHKILYDGCLKHKISQVIRK